MYVLVLILDSTRWKLLIYSGILRYTFFTRALEFAHFQTYKFVNFQLVESSMIPSFLYCLIFVVLAIDTVIYAIIVIIIIYVIIIKLTDYLSILVFAVFPRRLKIAISMLLT